MPCGARGDFYHIDAKRYRMGIAHISILRSKNIETPDLKGVPFKSGVICVYAVGSVVSVGMGEGSGAEVSGGSVGWGSTRAMILSRVLYREVAS